MVRYDSPAEILAYTQRRSDSFAASFDPWSIETLVEAQRRECAGASLEEIADEMGLSLADVQAHLRPNETRRPPRPERASVGYSKLKGRY